ncbi:hypothetical protein B2D07_16240 [Desulfococcus multivorans]|nr:uncharacterized protein Dmul_32450 [Desulfococcus multivorans]AQV02157.1 hypothetical protein B2D07_16240 [Desulfococcus multivorans]
MSKNEELFHIFRQIVIRIGFVTDYGINLPFSSTEIFDLPIGAQFSIFRMVTGKRYRKRMTEALVIW